MRLGKSQRDRESNRVASIAVFKDGKLLFLKRSDSHLWTLPGGHLNPGEDPADGQVRELKEETGLSGDLEYLGAGPAGDLTIHCYRCQAPDQEPDAGQDPDEEAEDFGWFHPDELRDDELHVPRARNVTLRLLGLDKSETETYEELRKATKNWVAKDGLKIPHHTDPSRPDWDRKYLETVTKVFGNGDPRMVRPLQIEPSEHHMTHTVHTDPKTASIAEARAGRHRYPFYLRMLRAGDRLPPVVVRRNGIGWNVLDGNGRMQAALTAGLPRVDAIEVLDAPATDTQEHDLPGDLHHQGFRATVEHGNHGVTVHVHRHGARVGSLENGQLTWSQGKEPRRGLGAAVKAIAAQHQAKDKTPDAWNTARNPRKLRKSEDLEKMAIKDLQPGPLIEDKPDFHYQVYDYTHLLPENHRAQGTRLTVRKYKGNFLQARLSGVRGERLGEVEGPIETYDGKKGSSKELKVDYAAVQKTHRGQGLGLKLYEALYAHAYHQEGIRSVYGSSHSTAAHGVHQALARKHGLKYRAGLSTLPDAKDEPGDFDNRYGGYGYNLKTELEKALPGDPREHHAGGPVQGAHVTAPHGSYSQAAAAKPKGKTETDHNLWVRGQTQTGSNKNRTLMVQFASDLLYTQPKGDADAYYDKLYAKRDGYHRPDDFWEVPQWQAHLAASHPDADSYVVRDPDQALEFFNAAGYKHLAFSALDVNTDLIQHISRNYGGHVVVGGPADPQTFQNLPNVSHHPDIQSFVESEGLPYRGGYDYRHFNGTQTIPRLTLSDGCLHNCSFCTVPKVIDEKSRDEVLAQADAIGKDLKSDLVYLNDKTFGQAKNHAMLPDVYDRIKAQNPGFKGFVVQTTQGQLNKMDPEFLKRAGIQHVELGVETFNDPILRKLHKPQTEGLLESGAQKLRAAGISLIPNIIIGLPGETKDSYDRTLGWLEKHRDIISHVNAYNLQIYGGTELGNQLQTGEARDRDENTADKSFWTDPELHRAFGKAVYDFGHRALDSAPGLKKSEDWVGDVQDQVVGHLSDDLRKPKYQGAENPLTGHCYVQSEAVFHLLGGHGSGWVPQCINHEGETHWYLKHRDSGKIVDPTAGQFKTPVPYEKGRGKGFLTLEPSKRAQELLGRIRAKQGLKQGLKKAEDLEKGNLALGIAASLALGGGTLQTRWTPKDLHPDLIPIAHLESSFGINQVHAQNPKGEYHTAVGALGLKPVTGHEEYNRSAKLQEYRPGLQDPQAFTAAVRNDTSFQNRVASTHFGYLKEKLGDLFRAVYGWRWGIGQARKATQEQIDKDDYVQKYRALSQKSGVQKPTVKKSEPLDKAMRSQAFRVPETGQVLETGAFHDSNELPAGLQTRAYKHPRQGGLEEGFVDHQGRFLSREEAAKAVQALDSEGGYRDLRSEDPESGLG